ncbi:MAG: DUF5104 domain-containing protein [Lachnospiraceae bacterium]|nr:DUF5104 domain-containing protein [Lachnospiraceae bacterium]
MAFAGMALAGTFIVFVIVMGILGFIELVGLIVLIVSLVKRRKRRKEGQTPKKGGLIAGIIMMAVPIILVGVFGLHFMHGGLSSKEMDIQACEDKLYECLMAGDSTGMTDLFSDYAKSTTPDISEQISEMLSHIDGGILSADKGDAPKSTLFKYGDGDNETEYYTFSDTIHSIKTDSGEEYMLVYKGFSYYADDASHAGLFYLDVIRVCEPENILEHWDAGSEDELFKLYVDLKESVQKRQEMEYVFVSNDYVRGESYRVGRIIEDAVLDKDGELIIPLFSGEVSGRYDLDAQIKEAWNFIDGDIVSIESLVADSGGFTTDMDYGAVEDYYNGDLYGVVTDKGTSYTISYSGTYNYRNHDVKVGLSHIIIVNDAVPVDSAGERPDGKVTIGK